MDPRADLYSLGVILYQLVTGQVPFEADTPLAVMLKQVHDVRPSPRRLRPELPEGLEAFLARPDITAEFAREARALGRTTDQVHQAWRSTLRRVEHEGRRPAPEEWDRVYLALRASIPPASGQGGGLESAHALAPGSPLVAEPAEDVLGALDQPERALLELRLGRAGEPPLSLAEAGQRLGLSAQDALSLEQQAMRRLGPGGWDEARRLLKERTRTA